MIVDTSALLAILFQEPDAVRFAGAIAASPRTRISAATLLETEIVLLAQVGAGGHAEFQRLLDRGGIEVADFTLDQVRAAREAYAVYGRGAGHPARLNFGDCFAYALAKVAGEPLLFNGADFAQTDIPSALS